MKKQKTKKTAVQTLRKVSREALQLAWRNSLTISLAAWFGFMWSWSFVTDSLELAGSKNQGLIMATLVVATNVALSVFIVRESLKVISKMQQRTGKWIVVLGFPLFALMDFLVGWLVAIIWIGPQGSIDNILPMGSLALPMVHTPLRFASRFIGFYGLAAVLWLTLYLVLQKKNRRLAAIPLLITAALSIAGYLLYRTPNGQKVSSVLVSETLIKRVPSIDPKGADFVLFPEYGLEKNTNMNLHERIKRSKAGEKKTFFIGTEQIYKPTLTGHRNSMMFGNTEDGITQREDKYRLIPGGEDAPYIVRLLLRATGQVATLDYFSYAKGVIKGKKQLQPFTIDKGVHIAAAVCSSIISPEDYRHFTASGATLLTNSASLSTFRGSRLFAWQQKTLGKFMATANARYFLQSANAASAYIIENNGQQRAEVRDINTLRTVAITNSRRTPYTRFGEWLAWLGAVLVLVYITWELRDRKLQNKTKTSYPKRHTPKP